MFHFLQKVRSETFASTFVRTTPTRSFLPRLLEETRYPSFQSCFGLSHDLRTGPPSRNSITVRNIATLSFLDPSWPIASRYLRLGFRMAPAAKLKFPGFHGFPWACLRSTFLNGRSSIQRAKGHGCETYSPCMQSFVDYGSIFGAVTLVDDKDLGIQIDAVGQYNNDTIFQIMSMTKPFVAVAIMKLVEQGKIPTVDSRVSRLPGFEDFPYSEITVKELLTHTSGIWYWKEPSPGVRTGIAPHLTNKLEKEPETTVRDKSLEFVARHYANPTLYPLESTTPQYSNIGYLMLGWIVERLSHRPFEQFVKETILEPLKMKDTFFFPSTASPAQQARLAELDRCLPDPLDYAHYDKTRPGWVYPSPAGGLYSTAEDLRRFLDIFRHRGQIPGQPRILSEASIALLREDQVRTGDYNYWCNGLGHSLGFYVVRARGCPELPGCDRER